MNTMQTYTVAEVAKLLHTDKHTIYKLHSEGKIAFLKCGHYVITQKALQDYYDRFTECLPEETR